VGKYEGERTRFYDVGIKLGILVFTEMNSQLYFYLLLANVFLYSIFNTFSFPISLITVQQSSFLHQNFVSLNSHVGLHLYNSLPYSSFNHTLSNVYLLLLFCTPSPLLFNNFKLLDDQRRDLFCGERKPRVVIAQQMTVAHHGSFMLSLFSKAVGERGRLHVCTSILFWYCGVL